MLKYSLLHSLVIQITLSCHSIVLTQHLKMEMFVYAFGKTKQKTIPSKSCIFFKVKYLKLTMHFEFLSRFHGWWRLFHVVSLERAISHVIICIWRIYRERMCKNPNFLSWSTNSLKIPFHNMRELECMKRTPHKHTPAQRPKYGAPKRQKIAHLKWEYDEERRHD